LNASAPSITVLFSFFAFAIISSIIERPASIVASNLSSSSDNTFLI
jgi:hypothetical protein